MRTLWASRFDQTLEQLSIRFGQSIESDLRFWQEDLICSVAHARMLGSTGIISKKESEQIIKGLEKIHELGPECLPRDAEDIHTAIELKLHEIAGDVAKKLNTARSRNDQIATDTRLYLHNDLMAVLMEMKQLQGTLLGLAKDHKATVMPGYTHMRPAQPITLSLNLLAHFWALQRHGYRAERLFLMANYCPLGSGAIAGTSLPIDRHQTSKELGFTAPIPNALDGTSDRSYMLDALHVGAMVMISLSRMCQELILWSSPAYGFVRLSEKVTTGSAILPQKQNPDMAELVRGRASRAIGNWVALASTMKALPLGYSRDFQDDKPALFETLDLVKDSLELVCMIYETADWNIAAMSKAASAGFGTALDLAEQLALFGVPFRDALETVAEMIREDQDQGKLTPATVEKHLKKRLSKEQLAEAVKCLNTKASVSGRESYGSTGPKAMATQIKHAERLFKKIGYAESV